MPPRKKRRGSAVASSSTGAPSRGPTRARRGTTVSNAATPAPTSPRSTPIPTSSLRSASTPTAMPGSTPLSTQRRGSRTPAPARAGHAAYRTRHARVVRGPELAAAEGGEGDLVPPSEDDEYDVWREGANTHTHPLRPELSPSPSPASPALPPSPVAGPSRFRPLFDGEDYGSSLEMSGSGSGSEDDRKGKGREVPRSSLPRRGGDAGDAGDDGEGYAADAEQAPTAVADKLPARASARVPSRSKRPRSASPDSPSGEGMDIDAPDPPPLRIHLSLSPVADLPPSPPRLAPAPTWPDQRISLSPDSSPSPAPQAEVAEQANEPASPPPISHPTSPHISPRLQLQTVRNLITLSSPHAQAPFIAIPNFELFAPAHGRTSSSLPPPSQSPPPEEINLEVEHAPSQSSVPHGEVPIRGHSALSQGTPALWPQDMGHNGPLLSQSVPPLSQNYEEESQLPLGMSQKTLKEPLSQQLLSQPLSQPPHSASRMSPEAEESLPPAPYDEESQLPAVSNDFDIPDLGGFDIDADMLSADENADADVDMSWAPSPVRSPAFVVEIRRPRRSNVDPAPARPATRDGSPDPLDFLHGSPSHSPDSPGARAPSQRRPESLQSLPCPPPSPPATGPSQDAHASRPQPAPRPEPEPENDSPPEDAALRQFRIARTFRTRTALQLQPYTREKQAYVKALARGGLVKGKRAVAPVSVVTANKDTDTSDSADQSDSDADAGATPPDAIVIGGSQKEKEPKKRQPKPLTDEDYDEYFLRFGAAAEDDDDEAAAKLQVIARERIKAAKDARRAARAADKTRRQFEALMAGHNRTVREDDRQRQKEEREREAAERQERREREAAERLQKRTEREADKADKDRLRRDKEDKRRARNVAERVHGNANSNGKIPKRPRVYGKRHQRPAFNFDDDSSELSDPPEEPEVRQESPTAFLRDDDGMGGFDGFNDFGAGAFDIPDPPPLASEPARARTPSRRRHLSSASEDTRMTPRGRASPRQPRSRPAPDSDSDSDSRSSASESDTSAVDKRERIARRMLPGIMLKRLAAAEKDKQRRREAAAAERRKTAAAAASPVRPGHAVRRRGNAAGMEGMDDLWDDESLSLEAEGGRREGGRARERERESGDRRTKADKENTRPRPRNSSPSPIGWTRTPPSRSRRVHDSDDDADLLLEPAHIDLSFSVHGSPESGTADAPLAFDLDAESDDNPSRSASPTPGPIVISSGSEAEEDNTETLAFLHRGDFEAILRGRSAAAVVRPLDHKHQADREKRRKRKADKRRPVLGHIQPNLVQARLDMAPLRAAYDGAGPVAVPAPRRGQMKITDYDARKSVAKDRDRDRRGKHGPRPAIRLDDRTIFAIEEFAFESDDESGLGRRAFTRVASKSKSKTKNSTNSTPTPHTPARVASHTPARMSPTRARAGTPRPHLDDGVGKARSWANFERFPIDFDITPLPSGVYLSDGVVADLPAFLAALSGDQGDQGDHAELKPVYSFGVHLHSGMDVEEATSIAPIVLDGARGALSAYIDDPSRERNDAVAPLGNVLAPLCFFRDLLLRSELHKAVYPAIEGFEAQLSDISLTSRVEDRAAVDQMVLVRYALLQIAIVAAPASIVPATVRLFSLLLTHGFDRTLKPIRRILRGEVDTPEIADRSVGVWVAVGHVLRAASRDPTSSAPTTKDDAAGDIFASALVQALEARYAGEIGPLAAERVWFLVFGLCALSQFDTTGAVAAAYTPHPRWGLVKRAIGLIKVTHSQETEEAAQLDQLQGRDRYIKTMVARCLRLSAAWVWSFDRSSFTVATRDLGMIFKERQHRNLPTEPPADFPPFIALYDISLTATESGESTRRASAFELYLRLASVAASDVIACAAELTEAQRAERDVQRLIMGIFPLSSVAFTRASPPTARQLAALVNRYSTMVVACYFSPALLPWLLSNSAKWIDFKNAGFESRQVVIRGLMYLAVAVRHHAAPLEPVVARLAEILAVLQTELDVSVSVSRLGSSNPRLHPTRVEVERTMVLVVTAFREIILHAGFAGGAASAAQYPDPALLHESWTGRIFDLDLAKDVTSGLEIVSTIQAYLDARAAALPKRAAAARRSAHESLDDWPSLGFDFAAVDLAALGGDQGAPPHTVDPREEADARLALILRDTINPKIYRLLNDMLSEETAGAERLVFVGKLTKCWSDCAAVVVVEHRLMDWTSYIGAFGSQSWARLSNEAGRLQVGLHFMLNVAQLDPCAFKAQQDEFLVLLLQALVADRLTIQHKYASALFSLPAVLDHALLAGVRGVLVDAGVMREAEAEAEAEVDLTRTSFLAHRGALLSAVFSNIAPLLSSRHTPAETKSFIYRAVNTVVGTMGAIEAGMDAARVLPRQAYRVFVGETVRELRRVAGAYVDERGVPGLRALGWVGE